MQTTETRHTVPEATTLAGGVCKIGILAIDGHSRICGCSEEAARLVGMQSKTLLGRTTERLPTPLHQLIQETLSTRADLACRRVALSTLDGTPMEVSATTTCCLAEDGTCTGVLLELTDPAAAAELRAAMQRLDRLASVGTLSASMAHEIKNALVAVNTFVETLVERNRDSELATLVLRELRRIDCVLSQMLKFAGGAKPIFTKLSVRPVLENCLRLMEPQLLAKRIAQSRRFEAASDVVYGDDYQLQQVVLNLFLNAVAAMEPDGRLTVSTFTGASAAAPPTAPGSPDGSLEVVISDTGMGIPPESLERIFEPFYSTKPQGTGLGLTITRRIIEEHHGTIRVESELTKGTTFRITLPLAT